MENYKLVHPEYLNHYGYLFGGNLLKWADEYSWIAACLDYPGGNFVTVGMGDVTFRKSVRQGAILRFKIEREREGTTSVQYAVAVYQDNIADGDKEAVFSTRITFVYLDESGNKAKLPKISK